MQLPHLTLMIATWELYFSFLITNLEGEECCLQRKSDTHIRAWKASEIFSISILQIRAWGPDCPEVCLASEWPVLFLLN